MNRYQKYKSQIKHYVYLYDRDDFYIKTYGIIQKNGTYYKLYLNHYNYIWHGDKIVEKLEGRGFVPIETVFVQYGLEEIENFEEQKTKKKSIFFRKPK